jgi:hypothetical protein
MTKKRNNNYIEYIYIILIFSLVLAIINLFFGEVIYCDDGSINSTNVLLGELDLQEHSNTNDNDTININCLSVFDHYRNVVKRKIFWYTCVKGNQPIITYNDFKKYWDPNTNVSSEIKKELVYKFYVHKNTFEWIVKPSVRRRWSRS